MGNLTHYATNGGGCSTPQNGGAHDSPDHTASVDGYASEDFVPGSSSSRERKKGIPWTEEEHRMFLLGLQKLGKGDWRGIARNFVVSRTPTQVASHAQKYFIRQSNLSRRKRRSSLFDIVADEPVDAPVESQHIMPTNHPQNETQSDNPLSGPPPNMDEECESKGSANSNNDGEILVPIPETSHSQYAYPLVYPAAYMTPIYPLPIPFWQGYNGPEPPKGERHQVLKPTAVHSKSPINVDELVGMSKLSLGESLADVKPPPLSLELVEGSTRQSAFHAKPVSSSHNPIHAV